jgi:tRNA-splicing ligase RtcB
MPIKHVEKRQNQTVPVKIWTDEYDHNSLNQLCNIAQLPFIHRNGVVAMPDVHLGKGATVGSVIATKDAIIPAAVGVDIGCGMNAVRLSLTAKDLPDNLRTLRLGIEERVPLDNTEGHGDDWSNIRENIAKRLYPGMESIQAKSPKVFSHLKDPRRWIKQIGTLGSGNHFIEICLDKEDHVWVMLHSGSRGIGNIIGNYFIGVAKQEMEKWHIHLPDKDLSYLPHNTEEFAKYIEAVHWAQEYALQNRQEMMRVVLDVLTHSGLPYFEVIDEGANCHHNYVELENHFGQNVYVTRKGAIRAREGDIGIIPGSMGARSYIVRGLGNKDSYCSCSHGAGRKMSRSQAKQNFDRKDLREQTHGIECRKDAGVIDEIPGAYKDIEKVMEYQNDLVEVLHELRQVVCIKG